MTTDLYALFRAIVADPDSDVPKLVAADYLEEHGDAEWAAFIRSELKAGPAVEGDPNESHTAIVRERFKALRKIAANIDYKHGFPRRVTMHARAFIDQYAEANKLWPLEHVKIIKVKGHADELAECKHLASVRWLDFDYNKMNAQEFSAIITSRYIRNVERLVLNNNPLGRGGALQLAAAELPKLKNLSVTSAKINAAGAAALFSSRSLGPITHWDLSGNPLTGPGLDASVKVSPHFADVEEMVFHGVDTADGLLAVLATVDRPSRLRAIKIPPGNLGDGFAAFANSPHFPHLERLDLHYIGPTGVPGLARLCQSRAFRGLHTLSLSDSMDISDDGLRALVGDGLPGLRTLDLGNIAISLTGHQLRYATPGTLPGFTDFVRSPLLRRIEQLDLSRNYTPHGPV